MRKTISIVGNAKNAFNMKWNQLQSWINLYWFKISLLVVIAFMLHQKDLNLQFNLSASPKTEAAVFAQSKAADDQESSGLFQKVAQFNIGNGLSHLFSASSPSTLSHTPSPQPVAQSDSDDNLSNTYSNMTYAATIAKKASRAETKKIRKQKAYVKRFAHVAQSEMRKYGIPASIKLAQGLIESNAGESRLSNRNNNHFGMKCFSRNCRKGHCSNFTDDSHKDFFRIYQSAWASYRAHSKMLGSKRYRPLFKLDKTDYQAWAYGLKKAGYATDKRYAEKLINIIEELKLYEFDKI